MQGRQDFCAIPNKQNLSPLDPNPSKIENINYFALIPFKTYSDIPKA